MKPAEIQVVMRVAQALLKVASERSLTLLGMLLCAGLFSWVLAMPDWIRFAGASTFAVLVYWPLVRLERAKQQQQDGGE